MRRLFVSHRTLYRYDQPVAFGPHELMLRPRDSHDLRLISATLTTSLPARLGWRYDVFGNVVGTARFEGQTTELAITSRLEIERFAADAPTPFETGGAAAFPPRYGEEERFDLRPFLSEGEAARSPELESWIAELPQRYPPGAIALLRGLCEEIHATFVYEIRDAGEARAPAETLRLRRGACRDFAVLFMAAARRLGFAARFVSGYLFERPSEGPTPALSGGGATHAWADVFVPDAGWIEFDPTNGLVASERLIRVATTRAAHQASPIRGSFLGPPSSFAGLSVDVRVEERGTPDDEARAA